MQFIPTHAVRTAFWLLFLAFCLQSCTTPKWSSKSTDEDQMVADIGYLASDKLKGRAFGSLGEMKAGDYIAHRFEVLGLKPMGENGTYFQTVSVKTANPHDMAMVEAHDPEAVKGRNVIGYLDRERSIP